MLQRFRSRQRLHSVWFFAVLARPVISFPLRSFSLIRSQSRNHRRYSTTAESVDEDPLKWERMYQQSPVSTKMIEPDYSIESPPVSSQIRVVTFDLDDTIWKTGATIASANDVLAAHLASIGIRQPKRVEVVMGELFLADKRRYAPVQGEDATSPVLLTLLRTDAIAYIATEHNGYSLDDALPLAHQAFQIWKQGRHAAIPAHLAQSVRECLETLANMQTSDGDKILIGAITDGNSDPSLVKDIGKYFDFCVNAEQVGVGKPNPDVYRSAVQVVKEKWQRSSSVAEPDLLIDPVTSAVGPWWIHIGDDFVKDIVAAKDFCMRSVWSRELVMHKHRPMPTTNDPPLPSKSLSDFDKEISSQPIVKIQIGSKDYLAESLEKEFADAIIDKFEDIAPLLTMWHEQGATYSLQAQDSDARELDHQAEDLPDDPSPNKSRKFCVACGHGLPFVAKFCASCGEKQE